MVALEAGAVEDDSVGGELVHRVHRLGAHLALLLRPAKHRLLSYLSGGLGGAAQQGKRRSGGRLLEAMEERRRRGREEQLV